MYNSCFSIFGKTTSNKQKRDTKKATWFTVECKVRKNIFIQVNGFLKSVQILKINSDLLILVKHLRKSFGKKVNSFRKGKLSSSDRVSLEAFVDHFKHISNTPHTDKVFDAPDFETIPVNNIAELDQPISFAEISKAIDSMKRGKSPGVDGLVSDFFIDAKEFLIPYLHRVYNMSLRPETIQNVVRKA